MDIKNLKREVKALDEGRWIDQIPEMGDLRLKVRAETSTKVAALRARKIRLLARQDRERDGSPKFDALLRITSEVLHEAVLLDWDGLTNEGAPVKYDPELAKVWLTDPEYRDFADAVAWAARVAANERDEAIEEAAGN